VGPLNSHFGLVQLRVTLEEHAARGRTFTHILGFGLSCAVKPYSLKGLSSSAQGNALGFGLLLTKALKGRNSFAILMLRPFRALS